MERVWYARGLRFQCARCGGCCGGAPGYVWLTPGDIGGMSRFLKLTEQEFLQRYCRRVLTRVSLCEHANYDCVFFTPAGCRVYPARPHQCRSFPFWPDNVATPAAWEDVGRRCPGVGRGRVYSPSEMRAIQQGKRSTD